MRELRIAAAERALRYLEGLNERGVAPDSTVVARLAEPDIPLSEHPSEAGETLALLDSYKLSSKGGTEMSTAANKALVLRWAEEVVSKGNLNTIDELFASNYVDHTNPPDWPLGSVGHKQIIALYHTAFPDFHYTIEHEIAEGDLVVVRGTYHGTHQGAFFGITPTGAHITTTGMHLFRIADGKIAEHWCNNDDLGVMRQLGVMS